MPLSLQFVKPRAVANGGDDVPLIEQASESDQSEGTRIRRRQLKSVEPEQVARRPSGPGPIRRARRWLIIVAAITSVPDTVAGRSGDITKALAPVSTVLGN